MKKIVQKFGGTSVATKEAREKVVSKIVSLKEEEGVIPVVVVSAIGRKGSPYATDTLLQFAQEEGGDLDARHSDLLLSCGEIISAVILAHLLKKKGHEAIALTGAQAGIFTDGMYQNAELMEVKPQMILNNIERGVIPVIAGFQGGTYEGEVTTLGRGGSDTTAAIIGAALQADRIEIFTDVDGIMTADPRVCDKAKIISSLTYEEIFQMADSGAKVIHPKAVQHAMLANVPILIKNTFSESKGTYIGTKGPVLQEEVKKSISTGIAHKKDRVQFKVNNKSKQDSLLEVIAQKGISIDLINIFPTHKIFTVDDQYKSILEEYFQQENYSYDMIEGCCKVTIIGAGMTRVPGVMSKLIQALASKKIEILQTADSLTTIACLIKEDEVIEALEALHDVFDLS